MSFRELLPYPQQGSLQYSATLTGDVSVNTDVYALYLGTITGACDLVLPLPTQNNKGRIIEIYKTAGNFAVNTKVANQAVSKAGVATSEIMAASASALSARLYSTGEKWAILP